MGLLYSTVERYEFFLSPTYRGVAVYEYCIVLFVLAVAAGGGGARAAKGDILWEAYFVKRYQPHSTTHTSGCVPRCPTPATYLFEKRPRRRLALAVAHSCCV